MCRRVLQYNAIYNSHDTLSISTYPPPTTALWPGRWSAKLCPISCFIGIMCVTPHQHQAAAAVSPPPPPPQHCTHQPPADRLYTRGAVARLATATANLPGGCPILNTSTCTRQQYYCREEEFNTKILLSCIKPFCRKATLKTTNWIQSALRDSCEVVLFTVQ